jgi:hypothetical protein
METALIGLAGVLLGIFVNEVVRRRNRIENYATRVFDKRLEIYEGLYQRVSATQETATDVAENDAYSQDERHGIVSAAIHFIAAWCDKHDMYINDELSVHCVPLLMGMEEVYEMKDEGQKKAVIEQFNENLRLAKKMIRQEAGIADIERLFSSITKPERASPIIDYYRTVKRQLGAKGRFE